MDRNFSFPDSMMPDENPGKQLIKIPETLSETVERVIFHFRDPDEKIRFFLLFSFDKQEITFILSMQKTM